MKAGTRDNVKITLGYNMKLYIVFEDLYYAELFAEQNNLNVYSCGGYSNAVLLDEYLKSREE